MKFAIIGLLLCFWIYLAYHAYQRHDTTMAGIYLTIGVALTVYRVKRAQ